jgi:CheY-like chemotaxis protein
MSQPVKILLVEDEYIIAILLQKNLELLGYHVCELAATGHKAIEVARKERPDFCLMDIRLSGDLDGIDAGLIIKDELKTPIIYMTGYSDNKMKERAQEVNPIAYLIKPVTPDDVKPIIDNYLAKRR